MVTATLALTSGALLSWPGRSPTHRLRQLTEPLGDRPRVVLAPSVLTRPPVLLALLGIAVAVGWWVFGIGVAFAVAVGGGTARILLRSRRKAVEQLSSAEAMADAMHGLVAELRSGAHPVAAAEATASQAREPASAVLTAISATGRLGGELTPTLDRLAAENPVLATVVRPLGHAWSLAQRHGLPLADVLDAVRRDVADRVRFARRVRARMAGPRASGTVLAVLPLLGVLLGEAMGARPLHVLLVGSLGQALLAVGTTLICVGLYWINRLTTRAVW